MSSLEVSQRCTHSYCHIETCVWCACLQLTPDVQMAEVLLRACECMCVDNGLGFGQAVAKLISHFPAALMSHIRTAMSALLSPDIVDRVSTCARAACSGTVHTVG